MTIKRGRAASPAKGLLCCRKVVKTPGKQPPLRQRSACCCTVVQGGRSLGNKRHGQPGFDHPTHRVEKLAQRVHPLDGIFSQEGQVRSDELPILRCSRRSDGLCGSPTNLIQPKCIKGSGTKEVSAAGIEVAEDDLSLGRMSGQRQRDDGKQAQETFSQAQRRMNPLCLTAGQASNVDAPAKTWLGGSPGARKARVVEQAG